MKRPFILKKLSQFNPDGVYGVGNQPKYTLLFATEIVDGKEVVTQMKMTDGITKFSELKNLLNEEVDLSGYATIQEMEDYVENKLGSIFKVKGSVANLTALNALTGMKEGDVYNVLDTGKNYVYVLDLNNTGSAGWDDLSGTVDLSNVVMKTGDQSVDGVKTFVKSPVVPNATNNTQAVNKGQLDTAISNIDLSNVVKTTGDQFIEGVKTFNEPIIIVNAVKEDQPVSLGQLGTILEDVNLQKVLNNGNEAFGTNENNLIKADPNSEFSVYIQDENPGYTQSSSIVLNPEYLSLQKTWDGGDTATGFTIERGGINYLEDYSIRPEFGDRTLVDKGYIDSVKSTINLQSVLNNGSYAQSTDGNKSIDMSVEGGSLDISFNDGLQESTNVHQTTNRLSLGHYYPDDTISYVSVEKAGLQYDGDYSQRPEFNDRNLVDKGYVDNQATLQKVIQNNGLASDNDGNTTFAFNLYTNPYFGFNLNKGTAETSSIGGNPEDGINISSTNSETYSSLDVKNTTIGLTVNKEGVGSSVLMQEDGFNIGMSTANTNKNIDIDSQYLRLSDGVDEDPEQMTVTLSRENKSLKLENRAQKNPGSVGQPIYNTNTINMDFDSIYMTTRTPENQVTDPDSSPNIATYSTIAMSGASISMIASQKDPELGNPFDRRANLELDSIRNAVTAKFDDGYGGEVSIRQTSEGITSATDFSANPAELDFVQRKFVIAKLNVLVDKINSFIDGTLGGNIEHFD